MLVTSLGALREVKTKGSRVKQPCSFNTVTTRDGIDVQKARRAFLEIDEYRRAISPDAPRGGVKKLVAPERSKGRFTLHR
jgi:hypothetical protein